MNGQSKAVVGTTAKEINADQVQSKDNKKATPVFDLEDFMPDPLKNVFIPDWQNRPAPLPPVLSLGGVTILSHQNSAAIIAKPGAGKSSVMEAILSSYLNPVSDNLGFRVDPKCNGIILIDSERTNIDVWNSYRRVCARANIQEGYPVQNIKLAGMRSVSRLNERVQAIEYLLESYPCSLLLIDGAGDLVTDTNDLEQAIECRIWLRELTVKYNLSVLVTIHPNPGSDKPRGHQGSEICRESESVLLIKPFDESTRLITTEFDHGKNRNNPKLTVAFAWSDNQKMFVSADFDEVSKVKSDARQDLKRSKLVDLAKKLIPPMGSLSYTELFEAIRDEEDTTEVTAKRRVTSMTSLGVIKKHQDGNYRTL